MVEEKQEKGRIPPPPRYDRVKPSTKKLWAFIFFTVSVIFLNILAFQYCFFLNFYPRFCVFCWSFEINCVGDGDLARCFWPRGGEFPFSKNSRAFAREGGWSGLELTDALSCSSKLSNCSWCCWHDKYIASGHLQVHQAITDWIISLVYPVKGGNRPYH